MEYTGRTRMLQLYMWFKTFISEQLGQTSHGWVVLKNSRCQRNAHRETIWVKVDGDQNLHQFQAISPGSYVGTTGG